MLPERCRYRQGHRQGDEAPRMGIRQAGDDSCLMPVCRAPETGGEHGADAWEMQARREDGERPDTHRQTGQKKARQQRLPIPTRKNRNRPAPAKIPEKMTGTFGGLSGINRLRQAALYQPDRSRHPSPVISQGYRSLRVNTYKSPKISVVARHENARIFSMRTARPSVENRRKTACHPRENRAENRTWAG